MFQSHSALHSATLAKSSFDEAKCDEACDIGLRGGQKVRWATVPFCEQMEKT